MSFQSCVTAFREQSPFLADVLAGLSADVRNIPCKYFYDRRGSELFDQITVQPEYYPTRAETELLFAHARPLAAALGPGVELIELGSGSSIKTRILLNALRAPARYVPIDISSEHLHATARRLRETYARLRIEPMVADYSQRVAVPRLPGAGRRVVFFPGSSVGNFEPGDAVGFLQRCNELAGAGGVVLVGADLPKDRGVLERAYDDAARVTAAFNLNVLRRMQSELGASLELDAFAHQAVWQAEHSRIEMRLLATRNSEIAVAGRVFAFEHGEFIVTEHCYKHDVASFRALAERAGLRPESVFLDPSGLVSLHWLASGP